MSDRGSYRCHASVAAPLWTMGWLFTIGWLQLAFWKGLLALLIWPYYIGEALSAPRNV